MGLGILGAGVGEGEVVAVVVAAVDDLEALLLDLDDGADLDEEELAAALADGAHLPEAAVDEVVEGDTAAVVAVVVVAAVAVVEAEAVAVVEVGLLDGDEDLDLLEDGALAELEALEAVVAVVEVEDEELLLEVEADAAEELLLAEVVAEDVAELVVVVVTIVVVAVAVVVVVTVTVIEETIVLVAIAVAAVAGNQIPEAALLEVLLGEEEGLLVRDEAATVDTAAAVEVAAVGAIEPVEVVEHGELLEGSSPESAGNGGKSSGTHCCLSCSSAMG